MKRLLFILILIPLVLPAKIYKGAEYRTKESFTYGRFEVRLKSAYREGMLTSFFTYNDNYPATEWNEIDIEILGRYSDDIQFNPITPGQQNHVSHYKAPFNPASDYHVYAFEWTPAYVAWFVDGEEVHRQTGAHIQSLNLPQKIMMNIWNPVYAGWVGVWDENILPVFSFYDWVIYSSYTPGSGSSGTGNNFTFQWKDDFDSWDQTRWDKATHTFNGNNCDFIQANAVFQDGKLILCLTKETAVGFTDNTPPSVRYARAEQNGVMIRFTEEIDPVSAELPLNYINTAMPVSAAQLQPDSQSVFLTLTNYNKDSITNVIITGVKDRSTSMNALGLKNAILIKSQSLSFPVKINCGGGAYNDYLPDQDWSPSVEYGRLDGTVYQNNATVSGAVDPDIYKSELNGLVEYKVRVPNGIYTVILMMAENYFTAAGKRVFSVAVQDTVPIRNLDIYAVAGKGVQLQRVVHNVRVTDGMIDIHFMSQVDNAIINGIVIMPVTAGVNDSEEYGPGQWKLGQNFPNPFNGRTIIPVELSSDDDLTIRFFDSLGRFVSELPVGRVVKGSHHFQWDGTDINGSPLASGLYYCVVQSRFRSEVKKLVVLK